MENQNPGLLGRMESVMKVVAAACLMAMALITGVDVAGRALFNTPLFGTEEIVTILAVFVAGLALPYTHSQGSHIGVEILYARMGSRMRAVFDVLTNSLAGGLFLLVAWRMVLYGNSLRRSGEVSMNLELPTYMVVYALGFCFLVFALCLLAGAAKPLTRGGRS